MGYDWAAMQLRTEIEISASPEQVWAVLSDFERYHEWNPFIPSIAGEMREGSTLRIIVSPPESREMRFTPTLLKCEPERELRWRGVLWFGALFSGEHFFRLLPTDDGNTRFVHGEDFKGILVKFMSRTLTHTARGFFYMNRALKERVEGKGSSGK
jgi:hypothetical protein